MEKIYYANINQKSTDLVILTSDKYDFRAEIDCQGQRGTSHNIIVNVYTSINRVTKYVTICLNN